MFLKNLWSFILKRSKERSTTNIDPSMSIEWGSAGIPEYKRSKISLFNFQVKLFEVFINVNGMILKSTNYINDIIKT